MLVKNGKLSKVKDVASTFSEHFWSIADLLNLFSWPGDNPISAGNDKVSSIVKKFTSHPSIKVIKNI